MGRGSASTSALGAGALGTRGWRPELYDVARSGLRVRDGALRFSGLAPRAIRCRPFRAQGSRRRFRFSGLYDVARSGLLVRAGAPRFSGLAPRAVRFRPDRAAGTRQCRSFVGSRVWAPWAPRAVRCRPDRQRRERFSPARAGRGTSALFRAEFYSKVIARAYQGLTPLAINRGPIRGRTGVRRPAKCPQQSQTSPITVSADETVPCTVSSILHGVPTRFDVSLAGAPRGWLTWRPCCRPRRPPFW